MKKYFTPFRITLLFIVVFIFLLYRINKKHRGRYQPISVTLEDVLAYTAMPSYLKGDTIPIYIHTTENSKAVLYHMTDTLEKTSFSFDIPKTIQSNRYDPAYGCNWNKTIGLPTAQLKAGYYYLKIEQQTADKKTFYLPVLIKSSEPIKIAVVASTNTWEAYNNFGGMSNYDDGRRPWYLRYIYYWTNFQDRVYLPLARPYTFDNGIELVDMKSPHYKKNLRRIGGEWALVSYLEKNKYEYNVFSDLDFALDDAPCQADLIIFHTHTEYWSHEMKGRLEQYLKKGGHVIFASGNNMGREIEYYDGGFFVTKQDADPNELVSLTGCRYNGAGYLTWAPYKVEMPEHWAFKGTNLKKNDVFGGPRASGWETDKIGFGSNDFLVLARGLNQYGPAFMVYKDCEKGGWVFNVASISFNESLQQDKNVDKIFKNLIDSALTKPKVIK